MDTNQIVDLSGDDCNEEALRKKIDQKKMNEMRRYIPFLEYISKLDPVRNHNYKQLLRWLKLNKEFPARMASTCENNIITKYNKIKNNMELPAHIVEVFTEKDAILISDEDDEQPAAPEIIDLEDESDSPNGIASKKDEPSVHRSSNAGLGPASDLRKKKDNKTITNKSAKDKSSSNTANSTTTHQSLANSCPEKTPNVILEEGEIQSDGDDKKENRDKDEKVVPKIVEARFLTPSEDDIINQELFKRIDSFDDSNHNQKEKEEEANTSILRQKNLESELFTRRSTKKTRSDSLSSVNSEDTLHVRSRKKKKKKRKSKKKDRNQVDRYASEVENHSARFEEIVKAKDNNRDASYVEERAKKPKKTSKKKNKEQKQSRLLYISDDEEDIFHTTKNNGKNMSEKSNDSKGKHAIASSIEPPTVILSDSNDEELSHICRAQEKNAEPQRVEVPSPKNVSELDSEFSQNTPSISNVMQDINSMNLNELNNIYSKLCEATGIQLEELLIELVEKSTQENKQIPQLEVAQPTSVQTASPEKVCFDILLEEENRNHNVSDKDLRYQEENSSMFGIIQHQMQFEQNKNQVFQPEEYSQPQQKIQRLCQVNMQCQQTVQLPFLHTLRRGLNLNDPRIVQRLKQIKDSPIHNLSIRESASLLMNRHASSLPQRLPHVPKITSKTARTYGEHKRLRELEQKRALEQQASEVSTITTNRTSEGVHSSDKKEVGALKNNSGDKEDKNTYSRNKRHFSESSAEESNQKVIETSEKTIMSFSVSKPLSRSSSFSEDSLLSSEKTTKSKENTSSGRITPFEREKVVSIVLEAIGPVDNDTAEKMKTLSQLHYASKDSCFQTDDSSEKPVEMSPSSMGVSAENKDNTIDDTPRKRKGRAISKKNVSKKSPSKTCGIRELNNLNCTFLDYRDIFEKNHLETIGGKRRCTVIANTIREHSSSDEIAQNSDDNLPRPEVAAAPIKRRRQTCSALQDTSTPKKGNRPPIKVLLRRVSENGMFGVKKITEATEAEPRQIEPEKQSKRNQQPIQEVQVKLKRLSVDEIRMQTNRTSSGNNIPNRSVSGSSAVEAINPSEEPVLVPISSKPVDCLTKVYTKPSRHLNINTNMTWKSTKVCAICNKRSIDLTSHYVQQHKTESFISRLTSNEIEILENEIKLATINRKRYKTTCVFCQDELEVHHFVQFHAHYSYHTGEYGFKCDVCEVVKPYREDIKSHQLRTSRCRNGKIRTNYLYQSDLKVIYLYICNLCNFVQLNEANIHKHQRDHHSFGFESPQHVKKCIICALDDAKVINELLPSNETESLGGLEEEYADSDIDLMLQEQEFVHECPLDIKDVLINLENEQTQEMMDFKCGESDSGPKASAGAENKLHNLMDSCNAMALKSVDQTHLTSRMETSKLSNNQMTTIHGEMNAQSDQRQQEIAISSSRNKPQCPKNDYVAKEKPQNELSTKSLDENDVVTFSKDVSLLPQIFTANNANLLLKSESPETLLGQLHGFNDPNKVMTILHDGDQASCVHDKHQPYEEAADVKPNINEIKVENTEEADVSVSSGTLVKHITYRKVTPGNNYFGLYKCMIGDCWFSTNEAEKFTRHVDTHKVDGQKLILDCAYCSSRHICPAQLVKHVRKRHSMSCYQCSECTYRSVVSANVSFHIEMNHKDTTEEKCIFKCAGRFRSKENKLAVLKEKMKVNVNRYSCRDCPAQYYSMSLMRAHIATSQHKCGSPLLKYTCIFCEVESNSLAEMQIHLVTLHPNDASYVVERELNNATDEDSIENLKLINMAPPGKNRIGIRVAEFKEEEPESVETRKKTELEEKEPESAETTNETELNLIERIKPLLEILTEKTGVYRSELYKCTVCSGSFFTHELWLNHLQNRHGRMDKVTCPYCPQQIPLAAVIEHFESHLRHEYICLHCIKTFRSKLELEDHFVANHGNFQKFNERIIMCPNLMKYYIIKGEEDSSTDWSPILEEFLEILRNRCIEELYENRISEWYYDIEQFCFEDVDVPQFVEDSGAVFKCLVNSCPLESPDENTFLLHLNQHTVPRSYDCPKCGKDVETSWESIKLHYMLHRSNAFYICSVCKFVHHDRSDVTEHIKKMHNSRDVPIIRIWRDAKGCKISVTIVIPANKFTFVTTTGCFCCGQGIANHLNTAHGIAICRKCELCGIILLNREEAEEHRKEHGSSDFTIRCDILLPSCYGSSLVLISPFRIDLKKNAEKRLPEVEAESPNKRIKSGDICLNIKQEVIQVDEGEFNTNYDNSCEKPSCSIKCVSIDQLVSKQAPNQSAVGSITIKHFKKEQSTLCPQNTSNYHLQNGNHSINPNISHQPTTNSEMQPTYTAPLQQVQHMPSPPIQFIETQNYSNFNTSIIPRLSNQHHQVARPQQVETIPNQAAANSVPRCYSKNIKNNMHSAVRQKASQFPPIQLSSTHRPTTIQPQKRTGLQSKMKIMSITLPNNQGIATVSSGLQPPPSTLPIQYRSPTTQADFQSHTDIISIKLPKNQGIGTISRSLALPYSTSSHNGPHCSYQSTVTSPLSPTFQVNSNCINMNQVQTQNSIQRVQTMEEIAQTIDVTYPEILPICEVCMLECTSFVSLLTHFQVVHDSKTRFQFHIERRVECLYCPYRGSIGSFIAHNNTFHPGKPILCRSVIDYSRCGICHGIFSFNPSSSRQNYPQCNCPTHKRIIADCINADLLRILQKYGCSNHIQNIHNQFDVPTHKWQLTELIIPCYLCEKSEGTIKDLIKHVSDVHNVNSRTWTMERRLTCLQKTKLIYPRGLTVSLSDLANAGYSEEYLKKDIEAFDAMPRNLNMATNISNNNI